VPQHALAGWFGALFFLLWQERRLTVGQWFCLLPPLALLSPLGALGILPFAAYSGISTLLRKELRLSDTLLPLATTLLSLPALLYLTAAGDTVGLRVLPVHIDIYILFELLEVAPYLIAAMMVAEAVRSDRMTLAILAICLLILPWIQIGQNVDFTMRVSIAPLAILAFEAAKALGYAARNDRRGLKWILIGALSVGSVTGLFEVARAIMFAPPPRAHCSLMKTWDRIVELPIFHRSIYFAKAEAIPAAVRPHAPYLVLAEDESSECWDRPWRQPRWTRN
jgi:hypothetical protein